MSGTPGRRSSRVNLAQHRAAARSTHGRSLSDRLFVDFVVHDNHHDAGNPKRHAGTDHRVRQIHHKRADLRSQKKPQKNSIIARETIVYTCEKTLKFGKLTGEILADKFFENTI